MSRRSPRPASTRPSRTDRAPRSAPAAATSSTRPAPRPDAASVAGFLLAALLPLVGSGIPLDETATPGAPAGRAVLAVLALIVLASAPPPARGPRWWRQPWVWLLVFGGLSLVIPRSGPAVPSLELPGLAAATEPLRLGLPADFGAGWSEWLRLALLLAILQAARRVRGRYLLAGLAAGALGMLVRGLQEYLPQVRLGQAAWRVFGGFANPNLLAGYLLVVIPAVAAAVALAHDASPLARWLSAQGVERPGSKLRAGAVILLVGLLFVLGTTGSRGALLALGGGALAACLGLYQAGWRRGAAGLLGLALLGAVLLAAGPLRPRLLLLASQTHSAGFRELTWRGTLTLIAHVPWFGTGLGGWLTSYPVFAQAAFTQHAHEGFLQVWAEGGLGSLLAKLGWLGSLLATGWRLCRRPSPEARAVGPALLAATVAFALHNAVDFDWYVPAIVAALVIFGALGDRLAAPQPAADRPRRGWLGPLLLTLALGLSAAAEQDRAAANAALQSGALGSARQAVEAGLRLSPDHSLLRETQAGLLSALRQPDAAETAYRSALAGRPNAARLWYRLAALQAADGRAATALEAATLAVRYSPMHLQGWLQLGRLLTAAGHADLARQALRELDRRANLPALSVDDPLKGYTFDPIHGYGLMQLAELALAAGDRIEARDAFDRARPDFDNYLATWRQEEAQLAPVDAATRADLLRLRGLRVEDRERVEALLARATEQVEVLDAEGPEAAAGE